MRHRRAQGILWMAMAALGLTGVGQAQQGHFETPHPVPGLDSRYRDWSPFPSADGLTMYFGSDRQLDGAGRANFEPDAFDLWRATREKRADDEGTEVPFGEPEFLAPPVNTVFSEGNVSVTADEKILCFVSRRDGGPFVYQATRATKDTNDPFDNVQLVLEINVSDPSISGDGLTLYFHDSVGDLLAATRDKTTDKFAGVRKLGRAVNEGPGGALGPSVSADGRALFLARVSGPPKKVEGLWLATRAAVGDAFGLARRLDLGLGLALGHPSPSADWPRAGSKLYFTYVPVANPFKVNDWDLYQADWARECKANEGDDREDIENE